MVLTCQSVNDPEEWLYSNENSLVVLYSDSVCCTILILIIRWEVTTRRLSRIVFQVVFRIVFRVVSRDVPRVVSRVASQVVFRVVSLRERIIIHSWSRVVSRLCLELCSELCPDSCVPSCVSIELSRVHELPSDKSVKNYMTQNHVHY